MRAGWVIGLVAAALAAAGAALGVALTRGEKTEVATAATTVVRTVTAAAVPSAHGFVPSSLQSQYVAVVKKVAPSVVQLATSEGQGAGVIIDRQGHIVTNAHVVGSAASVSVTLASGKRYSGALVGISQRNDLAVLRIAAPAVRPIVFGRSSQLEVGDIVLAIGNPLGFQSSVTDGIVSGLGRTVAEGNGVAIPEAIQTSAAINPGNSGGALVDLDGRFVGIPTLAATDPQLGQATGIGFAIPSDTVKDVAGQLVKYGRVVRSNRAYLGINVGETFGASGVYVGAVTAGGPAAKAGIRAGDVIVAVAGKATQTSDDLATVLAGLRPGRRVDVTVVRAGGERKAVRVTLGRAPAG